MISKQKEIFNKLPAEGLEEITELDKKVSPDNLVYKYKGRAADVKFNEFDNTLHHTDQIREDEISLADAKNDQIVFKYHTDQIREDEISLADAKNDQIVFKSNLGEIKKETKNIDQKSKKYPMQY